MHSPTEYLNGHGDVAGSAVIAKPKETMKRPADAAGSLGTMAPTRLEPLP